MFKGFKCLLAQANRGRRSEVVLNLGNADATYHFSSTHFVWPSSSLLWLVDKLEGSIFPMSHYSSCKSSKILLLRGKIKEVAYHWTFVMACPHGAAMSYPHCDLQFVGRRSQELLRDGCQRSYVVRSNTSQVGTWVLRHIHSYSISCLPILKQNLRLYQENQEVTFITTPPDTYLSPVRPPFLHPGSSTIFRTAAPLQWKQPFSSPHSQNCLAPSDISSVDHSKHLYSFTADTSVAILSTPLMPSYHIWRSF